MIEYREVRFGSNIYNDLLKIRDEVLRRPIGMQLRDKDIVKDAEEYHFAAFDNERAIGCVLLRPLDQTSIQLRQMAILDSYRGKNIGAQLVIHAEQFAFQKGFSVVETRARRTAEGFYHKLGYASFEDEFCDEHTLKMRKSLAKQ